MATTLKPLKATEDLLVPVDQDRDVLKAVEILRTLEEREQALVAERRAVSLAASPDTFGSHDHRTPLGEPELIEAHDRLRATAAELRQLAIDRPRAEAGVRRARAAASERAEPIARAQLAPLVARVWEALDAAAEAQGALEREADRLARAIGRPGHFRWLGWADLRTLVDDRRRRSG